MEREMAEVKRKQKERLQSAAKRRSTATCSSRDRDIESVALESVLNRFLKAPASHRRSRTPSPSSAKIPENSLQKNRPDKTCKKQSWTLNMPQSSLDKENTDDKKPEKKSLQQRKSGENSFVASENAEVLSEKEVQNLRDVSKKVLRYQSSRGSMSSGEHVSPLTSPHRRTFQEDGEKRMSVTNSEDVTKLLKSPLLLIPKSPGGIGRRHTIAFPSPDLSRTEADEDKFVPGEPENGTPGHQIPSLGNIGRLKSVDSYLPLTNYSIGVKVPFTTPTVKEEKVDQEEEEVRQQTEENLSSSQQNPSVNGQNNLAKKTSQFLSFFKRLGEKSKTNNREPKSSNVDH